jgi:beta-phosphoglucomutase
MIKTIIFDFDGVIVDTEINKFKDLKKILNNNEFALDESDFKDMIGKKTKAFLSLKFPNMKLEQKEKIAELRRENQLSNDYFNLIPGIKELLNFIKSKEIRMVITTGSKRDFVKKILTDNQIESFFDMLITGEDFEKSKPSPECYETTLNKLNLNSSEVIVIEDSVAGITSAKDANCTVFGIMTYLGKEDLLEADQVFKNHLDILDYLENNNKLQ